jgi:hypothetical protein
LSLRQCSQPITNLLTRQNIRQRPILTIFSDAEKMFSDAEKMLSDAERMRSGLEKIFSKGESIFSAIENLVPTIKTMFSLVETTVCGIQTLSSEAEPIFYASDTGFSIKEKTAGEMPAAFV